MNQVKIDGIVFKSVNPESCYRLVQFGRGQEITCQCSQCKAKNQTPEEARKAMELANAY